MAIVEVLSGCRLEKITIPPFRLEAKELVVLTIPTMHGDADDLALRDILNRKSRYEGIAVDSTVAVCELKGLRRFAKNYRGTEALASIARRLLSPADWEMFASIFMEAPRRHTQRWHSTGWTEIMALWMATTSHPASAVCVSPAGLDPRGVNCILRWAHDVVATRVAVLVLFYGEPGDMLDTHAPRAKLVAAKADS